MINKINDMEMKKLYRDYLPLIKSIAFKYRGQVPFEDLVQEGFLGLLEARVRFDLSKKAKFSTYAFYWIKNKILKAIRKEKSQSLNSVELNEQVLKDPIIEKNIEKTYESKDLDISSLGKNLSPLAQKILRLHFQEAKTLSQISKELGIRREKVRQVKYLLLRKIKINQKLTENLYAVNSKNV